MTRPRQVHAGIADLYARLLAAYGPQGWWPLLEHAGSNPTKTGSVRGYHPGDYSFPRHDGQRFEICAGAILTQNTAWPNVERALRNLLGAGALAPAALAADCPEEVIRAAVRPSGYFNAKTCKLRGFARFYLGLGGRVPTRAELLAMWGIGPETADSIRLYAYGQPELVVDAYTRRVLGFLGYVKPTASYEQIKDLCVAALPRQVPVYQEFHALMVEHAKRCYARRPYRDPLCARLGPAGP